MLGVMHKFYICVYLVLSLTAIGLSIWLHFSNSATLCFKVWEKPLQIVGMILLLNAFIRLVRFLCRVRFIICMCRISLVLFCLGVLCFLVFSILVTNRNGSRALFGRDGNYSRYLLEKYVMNAEQIKSCVVDYQTCQRIPTGKGADFYKHSLSHTQSSCCQPPAYCDLEFHNATYWTMPKAGPAVANGDCKIWNNAQSELCFKCQSCKTIFYDRIEKYWMFFSFFSFVLYLSLFGCSFLCYIINIWFNNRLKERRRPKVYPV